MGSAIQEDREELQDPFDADNLTETLRLKLDITDGQWMALGLNTDRVLMIIQVCMFALCIIFGLMVGISLGWAVNVNDSKCPLYAHLIVTADQTNKSLTVETSSTWGSDSSCNYCTFSAVCIAIYAIIWVWFFVLNSEWDRDIIGLPYDTNLLLPALCCSSVLFFVSLVSAGMISAGYETWCSYITQGIWIGEDPTIHCSDVKDLHWTTNPQASNTYNYLEYAVVGNWFLVIALGVKVSVCAVRMKQHYKVILKDEDDDLIDLYRRLDLSYEIIQTPKVDQADGSPFRKYGAVTLPKCAPKYLALEENEDSSDSEEPPEPHEESNKVLRDNLGLGASALHPDGIDGEEMSVRSDDPRTIKRRKSRLDSTGESRRKSGLDSLETIPETNL